MSRIKALLLLALVASLNLHVYGQAESSMAAPHQAAETEHHSIGERVAGALRSMGLPDPLVIAAISTLPIVELRGAVPVGHLLVDMPNRPGLRAKIQAAAWVYALAVAGNMVPIPFIILLLGPLSRVCMRVKPGRLFFEWLFARTRKKTAEIEKYETLGLMIFVAIPLPVTGGWTGAMAAWMMGMEFKHAMWSILLGVMIAGLIMTVVSFMGWLGAALAGVVLLALVVSALLRMFKKEQDAD